MTKHLNFNVLAIALTTLTSILPMAGVHASPKIRLEPSAFDFGFVPAEAKVTHRYWLANDGSDTLVVSQVKPSCGCTTVPLPTDRVAPGDSVPLDLVFSAGKMSGVVNKSVSVDSNDPDSARVKVYFTARVAEDYAPVEVTPWLVDLSQIDAPAQAIRIRNTSKGPLSMSLVVGDPGHLEISPDTASLAPGSAVDVRVRRAKGLRPGPFETSFTLWLDGRTPYPLTVPVKGKGYIE